MKEIRTNAQVSQLRIFVYGTLKRGYWNHDSFCHDALSVEAAEVTGRLYVLSSGIPVLRVPGDSIIAVGTSDPVADVIVQEESTGQPYSLSGCKSGNWKQIKGELMTFADASLSLPPIDRLEGFRSGSRSLYRRVLTLVTVGNQQLPAWCYVAGDGLGWLNTPLDKISWP